jgi:alanine-synthesizing transaminase
MFAERSHIDPDPDPLGHLLQERAAEGVGVFDLTASNPTRAGLRYDAAAILGALADPRALKYAPDPRGLPAARQAVAYYYRHRGVALEPARVLLTASTSEAYAVIFKLLGDPGDEILIPRPGYPLLSHLARFEGLRAVAYPARYREGRGWFLDLDVLEALVSPATRAVVAVSPNNPTGAYLKPEEVEALDALCRRRGLALIVDEVFADFPAAGGNARGYTTAGRTQALTFVLSGLSKVLGLPQLKLGWLAVGGEEALAEEACARLETLLDFYLSVGAPVQHAVGRLLGLGKDLRGQIQARLAVNAGFLERRLDEATGLRLLEREGGWYAVVAMDELRGDEEARLLELVRRDHVLVHPGHFYGLDGHGCMVLSLLTPEPVFRSGVERLVERCGKS